MSNPLSLSVAGCGTVGNVSRVIKEIKRREGMTGVKDIISLHNYCSQLELPLELNKGQNNIF